MISSPSEDRSHEVETAEGPVWIPVEHQQLYYSSSTQLYWDIEPFVYDLKDSPQTMTKVSHLYHNDEVYSIEFYGLHSQMLFVDLETQLQQTYYNQLPFSSYL